MDCYYLCFSSFIQEQYRGTKTIVVKSFGLLRALARGNDIVQRRIYDRMDSLLKVRVVEAEACMALKEVRLGESLRRMRAIFLRSGFHRQSVDLPQSPASPA
jgi:hypothetical protein